MKCPKCDFDCFAQAKRCVCGHQFTAVHSARFDAATGRPLSTGPGVPPPPPLPRATNDTGGGGGVGAAGAQMLVGLLFLVGGIAITAFTYKSAVSSGGGRYIVAHGPILFGAVQFLRGVGESMRR